MPGGQWHWANAAEIHEYHDFYDASQLIDQLLRTAALAVDRSIGIED
jgi:hypothetical protein